LRHGRGQRRRKDTDRDKKFIKRGGEKGIKRG
jgi:hypothetical protein